MPTPMPENTEFEAIETEKLEDVAGGAARASSSSNSDLTGMLSQITSSIKDLASSKNQGQDPMNMILMMMMMGGFGGGGGGVVSGGAIGAAPPVINVDTSVAGGGGGGCRRGGKKGW